MKHIIAVLLENTQRPVLRDAVRFLNARLQHRVADGENHRGCQLWMTIQTTNSVDVIEQITNTYHRGGEGG
jgi:hypothetical protein